MCIFSSIDFILQMVDFYINGFVNIVEKGLELHTCTSGANLLMCHCRRPIKQFHNIDCQRVNVNGLTTQCRFTKIDYLYLCY